MIKNDVRKILIIINSAKYLKSFIVFRGFGALTNCAMFVNIIGATIIDIAWIGSITSVKNPIAEDGRPKPRKPFIKPDIKKVNIKNITI